MRRFIKSQYAGKRAAPGSHSSRAQIETRYSADKSDVGVKSSALSDTSEAPSLGKNENFMSFESHKLEFINRRSTILLKYQYSQRLMYEEYEYLLKPPMSISFWMTCLIQSWISSRMHAHCLPPSKARQ